MATTRNIFELLLNEGKQEISTPLLEHKDFRLEHIVSLGQASEPGFWYNQNGDEWVLLARGEAVLEFEQERVELKAGDYLLIPAHKKHRVASCSQDAVWLALHVKQP